MLLVHPGGPYWAKKDLGSWSIPKGEYDEGEDPLAAAVREFQEETGGQVEGPFRSLGQITQSNRKTVSAWAVEGDFDPKMLKSNLAKSSGPPKAAGSNSSPKPIAPNGFRCRTRRARSWLANARFWTASKALSSLADRGFGAPRFRQDVDHLAIADLTEVLIVEPDGVERLVRRETNDLVRQPIEFLDRACWRDGYGKHELARVPFADCFERGAWSRQWRYRHRR